MRTVLLSIPLVMVAAFSGGQVQPVPRVKISGTVRMELPSHVGENSRIAPRMPPEEWKFQTWLLGDSFITRVSGTRPFVERIKESKQVGGIQFSDESDFKRHVVPYTFVIAYQPDTLTSPTDFPVRYFESPLDKNFTPRFNNMTRVSVRNGAAWYGWWLLQRATLAAEGRPTGTTSSVEQVDGGTVNNYYLPYERWDGNYVGQEHIRCETGQDRVVVSLFSRGWMNGREDPEFQVQQTTYSTFDEHWPTLPRRAEIDINMVPASPASTLQRTGFPSYLAEVTAIEEVDDVASFDDLLKGAAAALPRLFQQMPRYQDPPLTNTQYLDFEGKRIANDRFANRFVLVHCWASWASDNEKRFREVQKIVAEHSADPMFAAISLCFDADQAAAKNLLARIKPNWQQAYVGPDADFARSFNFKSLPAAVFTERITDSPRRNRESYNDNPGALFGGDESSSLVRSSPDVAVRDRLGLEKRRNDVGGVYAEMIGEEGRKILKSATTAEAYLLMGYMNLRRDKLPVPETAEKVGVLPIIYRWPDLPRDAVKELGTLLTRDDSYAESHHRDESDDPPSQDERFHAIVMRANMTKVAIIVHDHRVEFEVSKEGEHSYHSTPQLLLTNEASARVRTLLETHCPDDASLDTAVQSRFADWAGDHQRRLQDTVTSESIVPPVRITGVWQGLTAIELEWDNPESRQIMVLRSEKRKFDAIPEHGRTYKRGETIGDARVVYTGQGGRFLDDKLAKKRYYYYKVYACEPQGYSGAKPVRVSTGEGIRLMDIDHFSEFQMANREHEPGLPEEEYDFRGENAIIGYDTTYIMRYVGKPGQKPIELDLGKGDSARLPADKHQPIGGAATYTARIHYGSDQRERQVD